MSKTLPSHRRVFLVPREMHAISYRRIPGREKGERVLAVDIVNTVRFREVAITAAVENGRIGGRGSEPGLDNIGDLGGGSSQGYGA